MNIITIVGLGLGAFIVLMIGIFFYFNKAKGSGKKYPFLLYSRDGKNVTPLTAKIKLDPDNKNRKVFVFESYDSKLQVKPATIHIAGKGYRQVTMGDRGELVYLADTMIDEEDYLTSSMSSEDVAVLTGMLIENNKEFENPLGKTTAALLIGMAVIALLIMVGNVYSTITLVGNSKDMAAVAKENQKTTAAIERSSTIIAEVTAQQLTIISMLTEDANITRRLG